MSGAMNLNRREFLAASGSAGLMLALGGCRHFRDGFETRLESPSQASPNYWCTWDGQSAVMTAEGKGGRRVAPRFAGDQGGTTRDWMNEELVFGQNGYASQFPGLREDLFLVLDDGWDVPYGATPSGTRGVHLFGRMVPHASRFPSLKGTPGEKIAALAARTRDFGWRGLGLWVSPTVQGGCEAVRAECPESAGLDAREEWKRKLAWCAEGGVGYLKVDWGTRHGSAEFRAMLSDIKNEIAPHIFIEHCCCQPPFNGVGMYVQSSHDRPRGSRRLVGDADAELRAFERQVLPKSDVWRIYDLYGNLVSTQSVERIACDLSLCEATGSRAVVSTEDSLYAGATLGCAYGIMRSALGRPKPGCDSDPSGRLVEVKRAVRWSRLAPAFPATPGFEVRWSERTLSERTVVKSGYWYAQMAGKPCVQEAPAVVSRGLPLPDVSCAGEAPYVLAARHPNGAVSVAALPRHAADGRWSAHRADVRMEARMDEGRPLGVFGRFGALTVAAPANVRVLARDLAGGCERDITAACRHADGWWTLPGDRLEQVGGELTDDKSLPAALVRFAGA